MTEERTVDVPVVTVGESVAVTQLGGTLTHIANSVRIRALPDHLPQSIEVSIEGLASFDDAIHVRDLRIPSDAHVLNDPDEVIARVLPPRIEAEPTPAAPVEEAEAPAEGGAAGAGEETEEG
jgi:large subunit ribosomal protein L25